MSTDPTVYPPLDERPLDGTICLFDVDNTLSLPRKPATPEMLSLLSRLRQKCAIAYVSGSDLPKQQEQLSTPSTPVASLFDFCFAENGLVAYRLGHPLPSPSFPEYTGQPAYNALVAWLTYYVDNLHLPFARSPFLESAEFRHGMINAPFIRRGASYEERDSFEAYDKLHGVRRRMVKDAKVALGGLDVTYLIGGQISVDVFPRGWDKTYCLGHVEAERGRSGVVYDAIHFFGDMTRPGGNDYEIFVDERTIGHTVEGPGDCMGIVKELFGL
ncbi:hypothetical protein BDW74DRAFT_184906 [Aspergillus multicolor]|uniref:uncharacterized protein n=1 Tax=Aspergillus multicolor TaxID=41759 RepID=UPI003CCCA29F